MGDLSPPRAGGAEQRPTVEALYRYPVKSMGGEAVDHLDLDARGCGGDRLWSVRTSNGKIGSGKSTRRFTAVRRLLQLRASLDGDTPVVALPDGRTVRVDQPDAPGLVSAALHRRVHLARETDVSHYDDGPVSLLGTGSVAAVAAARATDVAALRFRPNILLQTEEPFIEHTWVAREIRLGTAVLHVTMESPRCVMINMATADLPAQPGNLKTVAYLSGGKLGVVARVVRAGTIRLGDVVHILPGITSG